MTAPLQALGIGDLHLDGHYANRVPEYNALVLGDVRRIVDAGLKKGVTNVFLYGDLGHRSTLSESALQGLVSLFRSYVGQVQFYVIKGNHEDRAPGESALDILKWACELLPKRERNVRFFLYDPETVEIEGHDVRFLPYPHVNTKAGCLNVLHADAKGSKRDNGHPVHEGFRPNHFSVVGHNHTAQVVENAHYSGTFYQTKFGEAEEKFYHLITWTGDAATSRAKLVPFSPSIVLGEKIIKSQEDYEELCQSVRAEDGVHRLFKVYVSTVDVQLPHDAFDNMPSVLKRLEYGTKKELKALRLETALDAQGEGEDNAAFSFDLGASFTTWAKRRDVDADLAHRAAARLELLLPVAHSMQAQDATNLSAEEE